MKKSKSYVGQMMGVGVGNLVGVGLIGASAGMVGGLPTGTAKTLAGTAVGLQGVALLGPNLKLVKSSFSTGKSKKGDFF